MRLAGDVIDGHPSLLRDAAIARFRQLYIAQTGGKIAEQRCAGNVWDLESQPLRSDQRRTEMPSVKGTPLRLRHRTILVGIGRNNGQILILAGDSYDANDPKRT